MILVTHQLQFLTRADKIVVLKDGQMTASGSYDELINESVDFLSFLEKKQKEEERKETLTKQKSLSLKKMDADEDAKVIGGRSMSNKSSGHPLKRQLSRTVSMSRSRSSSLSQQSASFHGDEEIIDTITDGVDNVQDELGQGMTREEKSKEGTISSKVYWDYLRSGASVPLIFLIFGFALATQGLFHFTDLWLADWTTKFEPRLEVVLMNETINATNEVHEVNRTISIENHDDQTNNAIIYTVLITILFFSAFIRTSSVYYLCLRLVNYLINHD